MTKHKNLNFKGYAFNLGVALNDSKDIQLLDNTVENLQRANSWITGMPDDIPQIRDFPEDSLFFYKIEQYDDAPNTKRTLEKLEEGVGLLEKRRNQYYLVRQTAYKRYTDEDGSRTPLPTSFLTFDARPGTLHAGRTLIITTRVPDDHKYLYAIEDTVLCSSAPLVPNPVYLDEKTVLGKINGSIQDVSGPNLGMILGEEGITSCLMSTSSPLITSSSKFDVAGKNSIIISNSLLLKPTRSRPSSPLPGQLIYNSRKKCFEGYDGNKWRPLEWSDA